MNIFYMFIKIIIFDNYLAIRNIAQQWYITSIIKVSLAVISIMPIAITRQVYM